MGIPKPRWALSGSTRIAIAATSATTVFLSEGDTSKKRVEAVVNYPEGSKVIASVATTKSEKMVIALGYREQGHFTYPRDGRFHITLDDGTSSRSFLDPGPSFENLNYQSLATVDVPKEPSALVRQYQRSSAATMTLPAPTGPNARLEIGVLGQQATAEAIEALKGQGGLVEFFQGPRSDTTIVLCYIQ